VVSDHDLVLAAAATYDPANKPFLESVNGALRVFTTKVGDVTVVAIEGTHDPLGWAIDFLAIPTEDHETGEHFSLGFLHAGFYASALEIIPALKAIKPPFALTGHSLGAALALLIGALLIDEGRPPVKIGAFAPPRVGGDRFVSVATSVPFCAYRFGDDPVTDVPLTLQDFPYRQVPLTTAGKPKWIAIDCHHIANYVSIFEPNKQENDMTLKVADIEALAVTTLNGVVARESEINIVAGMAGILPEVTVAEHVVPLVVVALQFMQQESGKTLLQTAEDFISHVTPGLPNSPVLSATKP
jgi:hypothetical protein